MRSDIPVIIILSLQLGIIFLGTSRPKKHLYVALPLHYWNGMNYMKEVQNPAVLKDVCFYCVKLVFGLSVCKAGHSQTHRLLFKDTKALDIEIIRNWKYWHV